MQPRFTVPNAGDGEAVVASYASYAEAQAAVDALADRRFPVEGLAIVARDLRLVEQVTGRTNAGRAALQGALSGAGGGALLGFFFGLFDLVTPIASGLVLAFWGALIGAVVGGLIGLVGHWATGGRRDFSSVAGMAAGRYDVVAAAAVVERARQALSELRPPSAAPTR